MSQPGWYPDPSGGGQRYWDGQQWGPTAPPPLTAHPVSGMQGGPKKPQTGLKVFILIAVLLFLGAAMCSKDDNKKSASTSTSSSSAATTSAPPSTPRGTKFHTEQGTIGEILFAEIQTPRRRR